MIALVPYRPEFARPLFDWRKEAANVRHNPLKVLSFEENTRILETECADLSEYGRQDSFRWFALQDGVLVGSISLKNISLMMATAEIGYGIAESHQGRGIATECVKQAVTRIFADSPIRRILAHVHVENVPSRRVLEKLGFTREGTLREHYIILGNPVDEAVYAVLKREWPA